MNTSEHAQYATVSRAFIADWLTALRPMCSASHFRSLLERSNLHLDQDRAQGRVTLDQIVSLYQLAAVETGDEMMGLWSRPIKPRALQHLLTTVREASSLHGALYRFSTFWNMLLDDYQFELVATDNAVQLILHPTGRRTPQRFGHMLILKLAHGLISWLVQYEVPVKAVAFAFDQPEFSHDYAVIFPAPVTFARAATSIAFERDALGPVHARSTEDLHSFLQNAPRDWIFTRSSEHTQSLRVRRYLSTCRWEEATLQDAARAMNMTPRTLIRRLETDGTSFQSIKDALRRDLAIGSLQNGQRSIEAIALDLGFSSAASFHKAFRRWTGNPPSLYRRQHRADG
ncbi:AraC family transcriptional regulator [Tateyamaria sp. ANG-S1]|uniref:helix-turn-helix domain-containing protein n=1 Tax=Tateyamaria sp. ANG-S1 TaxID=1577905 RepID=UPI0005802E26|nr:AraC family transcriptional regulator [Tateyamaria sp. ANG-S1]KIC49220.1 AraC family transcriptional regulator [Tateyamaria sp. ANG-S1]